MTWDQLLTALLALMGRQVDVCAHLTPDRTGPEHPPFLTTRGELQGADEELAPMDAVTLGLSGAGGQAVGEIELSSSQFTTAVLRRDGQLCVQLGSVTLEITAAGAASGSAPEAQAAAAAVEVDADPPPAAVSAPPEDEPDAVSAVAGA